MVGILSSYLQLTKPTIMVLVVLTGATALILEGSTLTHPFEFFLVLAGLYLTGGGANAFNQYFERGIDARMKRTRTKRPLPLGKLTAAQALSFSIATSIAGIAMFGIFFNWFSALLSLATILFYSLFYTLWLKPNTTQNIVIGGIAGSMAPVIAWAAAAGSLSATPWILFLIVFFWTPPHFWALALCYKEDYDAVDIPMMPVVKGDDSTLSQILVYSILLLLVSLTLLWVDAGLLYLAVAVSAGALFIKKSLAAKKYKTRKRYFSLFTYSIAHLFVLFVAIIVDGLLF